MIATVRPRSAFVPTASESATLRPEAVSQRVAVREDDPGVERRHRAEGLAAIADGRRGRPVELRSRYLRRLHRASDDFGTTEGLRVTEAVSWAEGLAAATGSDLVPARAVARGPADA